MAAICWFGRGCAWDPRPFKVLTEQQRACVLAEGALLAPEILSPPWVPGKYFNVGLYLLHEYGILCPQVRDLYNAGALARNTSHESRFTQDEYNALKSCFGSMSRELAARVHKRSAPRTARIPRALVWCLLNLESKMHLAADYLSPELFDRYWGSRPNPDTSTERLKLWVAYADQCARYWRPSQILFRNLVSKNGTGAAADIEDTSKLSVGRPRLRLIKLK